MPADTAGKVSQPIPVKSPLMSHADGTLSRPLPVRCAKTSHRHEYKLRADITQAAVAWEAGKDLSIEDIEVQAPKAHEVRIEIYYTGVCHTGLSSAHLYAEARD